MFFNELLHECSPKQIGGKKKKKLHKTNKTLSMLAQGICLVVVLILEISLI